MQRHQLVSWLATTTLAFTTITATAGCLTEEDDNLGDVSLNLVGTSPSGATYALRNAQITVAGPGGTTVFSTDVDPLATRLTGHVAVGQYTADLSDGWHLDRIGSDGVGVEVVATLISADPAAFEVLANSNTDVPLRFRTEGEIVELDQGDFGIVIDVDDSPAFSTLGFSAALQYSGLGSEYLYGFPVDVSANATLRQLGYTSLAGQSHIRVALYTDVGGEPANLVAQVGPVTEVTGINAVDVTAQPLAAGRYWLFASADSVSGLGYGPDGVTTYKYLYQATPAEFPAVFPPVTGTGSGYGFNYFIVVSGL